MKELIADLFLALQAATGLQPATFALVVRALSTVLTVLGLVLVILAVRRMRRPTRVRWFVPLLGMGFSVLGSGVYLTVMRPPVNLAFALPLMTFGLLLGFLQGWQTKMYWQSEVLMARRTMLYLGLWGFAYVATHGLAQLQSAALHAVGVLTMMLTVGVAIGSNVNLGMRQLWMRSRGPSH